MARSTAAHKYSPFLTLLRGFSAGRGCVDFGALKVLSKAKQVLTLKNRGKYEIVYSFKLEAADTNIPDLASHFTVHPQKGMLASSGDSMHIHLLFHPKREMSIEDKAILQCQVIDPSISEGDEIAAVIPIRVSGKAVFSKYSISPASLINFGVVLKGTRKTHTFTLENKGVLAFKFHICRVPPKPSAHQLQSVQSCMSEDTRTNAVLAKKSKCLLQQDAGPVVATRFTLGMFTVYPGFGSIPPGDRQTVTIECRAATLGKCKEHLSIDIQGRNPTDNPLGIPYTLFAESCFPAFVVDDIESIFEEHRICGNKKLYQSLQTVQDKGVFITDENRFIFTNVVVGHQAEARFKIRNVNKVPCDVVLSVKPISTEHKNDIKGIFKVDPLRMCVPSRSHAFATVTFTPLKAKNYRCTFEASLDIQASPAATKAQSLTFSITGAGNLPQVTVLRLVLRDEKGNPLLLFKKLLLGDSEELPLVICNSGIVPVQVRS
ncbi:hydrocephalus-inducing protein homolog [Cuculus canorus]|uniref:hydrocephalus-inducing protein homolog n=1 Tax=Cuculus canorus TaxID=55661 RepID=UPI0023AB03FE|nr:hydrocephalus-inducing protein homolog [Cuculus canorus]